MAAIGGLASYLASPSIVANCKSIRVNPGAVVTVETGCRLNVGL